MTATFPPVDQDELSPDNAISENFPSTAGSLVLTALASTLAACGGSGGDEKTASGTSSDPNTPPPEPAIPPTETEAARFLLQAQFSASDSEIAAVKSLGYAGWLNAQMALSESGTGTAWLDAQGYYAPNDASKYYTAAAGDYMAWHQLITNPQAVRQRLSLALSEMLVVSIAGLDSIWPAYMIAGYWDMLTANAFGNFRTLLEALTLNPAMGLYLSTRGNKKENAQTGRLPDENYAREIMQLFTIGLYKLNADGTPQLDSGSPVETYTAADISNLARVFTGYSWDYSQVTYTSAKVNNKDINVPSTQFTRGKMKFTAGDHSTLAVNFLGSTIPAGTDGATALKMALDTLFNHANTGPFFARQMIQRLVTSNPTPAYVGRVAQAFANNGNGVRGDLKAVWRAILTDTEARTLSASTTFGKVREPVIRFAQWARTFNAASSNGKWQIYDCSSDSSLGQSPLRSPSVFNFYRPGYVPPLTSIADQGLVAPEFQIHSESTTAGYVNFINHVIANGFNNDVIGNYTDLLSLATDLDALIAWLNLHLSANQLTAKTTDLIRSSITAAKSSDTNDTKFTVIKRAILFVMCSPEYLIQK